jgi:hypothetical protein
MKEQVNPNPAASLHVNQVMKDSEQKIPNGKLATPMGEVTTISRQEAEALAELLSEKGTARQVFMDKDKMREYLDKHLGKEEAARFMAYYNNTRRRGDRWNNSGYTEREDGTKVSINAVGAEENGTFTASAFKKVYGVPTKDFDMLVKLELIKNTEWHHTGKSFKKSEFYSWADSVRSDGDVERRIEYGNASKGEVPKNSLAQIYQNNKKEIGKLAREFESKSWEYTEPEVKADIESFESFAKNRTTAELTEQERKAREMEHGYISNYSDENSAYVRKTMHEEVDDKYNSILQERKAAEVEKNRAELERKYSDLYGEAIKRNKQVEKDNAKLDSRNRTTEGKESVLLKVAALFGVPQNDAYSTAKSISVAEKRAKKRAMATEKRKNMEAEKRQSLDEWVNEQRKKGNIADYQRVSTEPQYAYRQKQEMSGKYGWFDSSGRGYNLPEYYSGLQFASQELLNEYGTKQIEIEKLAYCDIQFMSTSQGEVYGFVTKEGGVYLDPEKLNANTLIHEFGHLWCDYVEKHHPELWTKISELTKQTDYYTDLLRNPAYAHLSSDNARVNEAFAQAVGDHGERVFHSEKVDEPFKEKFRRALHDFWRVVGEKLGIRELSAEQAGRLTFRQAVAGAMADMTNGKKLEQVLRNDSKVALPGKAAAITKIGGVALTAEQRKALAGGKIIYLEGLTVAEKPEQKFSSSVRWNTKKGKLEYGNLKVMKEAQPAKLTSITRKPASGRKI